MLTSIALPLSVGACARCQRRQAAERALALKTARTSWASTTPGSDDASDLVRRTQRSSQTLPLASQGDRGALTGLRTILPASAGRISPEVFTYSASGDCFIDAEIGVR